MPSSNCTRNCDHPEHFSGEKLAEGLQLGIASHLRLQFAVRSRIGRFDDGNNAPWFENSGRQ